MFGPLHNSEWIPLATQQLRLRHLVRIIGYNVSLDPAVGKGLYYTLHLTTMCSPFYTSEMILSTCPKWEHLEINDINKFYSGMVIRIWQNRENKSDDVITVWGVYFSGLVFLGTRLSELQPTSFEDNTLIFEFVGGYFTSQSCVKVQPNKTLQFTNNLNIVTTENDTRNVYRKTSVQCSKSEVRNSYSVEKLQRLHRIQQSIKNKMLDAEELREKIKEKNPLFDKPEIYKPPENISRVQPNKVNLLSMSVSSLNKFLNQQSQPSRYQRQEIFKIRKLIEDAKFRCKLLSQEKDRKSVELRKLTNVYTKLMDENDDQSSLLMDKYRQLSREFEKFKEWRKNLNILRETHLHTSVYLNLRRKQLMCEILDIYSIVKTADNKYAICSVLLPDSESLGDSETPALSVAFGYVTHVVQMCGRVLHVPLRYPLVHYGSRSRIIDHITENLPDKEREFPLYARDKDHLPFHYAVYLLNKNIAQLRWYCGIPTYDLKATLPNLLSLLQFRPELAPGGGGGGGNNRQSLTARSQSSMSGDSPHRRGKTNGLARTDVVGKLPVGKYSNSVDDIHHDIIKVKEISASCDKSDRMHHEGDCQIEQGLDLLDPRTSMLFCSTPYDATKPISIANKLRTTRSAGSYTTDEDNRFDNSPASEPLNKASTVVSTVDRFQSERDEFLQEWLNSGPALVCSEEHLYPEEVLGFTVDTGSPSTSKDHI